VEERQRDKRGRGGDNEREILVTARFSYYGPSLPREMNRVREGESVRKWKWRERENERVRGKQRMGEEGERERRREKERRVGKGKGGERRRRTKMERETLVTARLRRILALFSSGTCRRCLKSSYI